MAWLCLLALLLTGLALQGPGHRPAKNGKLDGDELFSVSRVWNAHLTFSPSQWEAMQPLGGPGLPGGSGGPGPFPGPRPPTGPPAAGGPAGPGGPPPFGGPPRFGPSLFLGPVFLGQGDTDQDGQLSREEFLALGAKWFKEWDTQQAGSLDMAQLRTGLNVTLAPPGDSEPGRPAGPAAQGSRMLGLSFQGPEGKRNGSAAVMGIEFPYTQADLTWQDQVYREVSVRYKGNGTYLQSAGSQKISFKVDLNDGFPGRKLGGVTKLNFHNNVTDASWMNEVLSYQLFRDAGVPASRTTYARLYVTVPGKYDHEYFGLYSLVENVDNRFAVDRFGTKKGILLKPVPARPFEDQGDDWADYRQAYDAKTPIFDEDANRLIAFKDLYLAHLQDFNQTIFRPERIHRQVDEIAAAIRPAVEDESVEKLARFDKAVAGEPASAAGPLAAAIKPIKGFVTARAASVQDQLAGKADGAQIARFGFGAPGGPVPTEMPGGTGAPAFPNAAFRPGPPSGPGPPRGFGPPGGFGPGMFWAPVFVTALDADEDGEVTKSEFRDGFRRWFESWADDKANTLTDSQLRAGIDQEFSPFRAGRRRQFGFPPPGFSGPSMSPTDSAQQ